MIKKNSLQFWLRVMMVSIFIIFCLFQMRLAGPFILSLIMTLILWPVVNKLEDFAKERCGIKWFRRWMAIIPTFIVVGIILTLIFNFIFVPFVTEFTKLLQNIPFLLRRLVGIMTFIQIHYLNSDMPPQLINLANETIVKLGDYGLTLAEGILATAMHLAGIVVDLLVVPIMTFYLLKDGRLFVSKMQGIFNEKYGKHVLRVMTEAYYVLGGYVRAELALAINMFIVVFISMSYFGVSYPLVLALLAGVAEWMPIVGPILAALFAIVMASIVSLKLAFQVAVFYLIVQLIDGQIIKPKVFGSFFNLHPIVIIAVVFIFGSLYGAVGMLLAVPGTALAQILARELWYYNKIYKAEKRESNDEL